MTAQQNAPVDSPKILPIGEWLPDLPPLGNPGILTALNCVPQTTTSYGPLPEIAPIGLPAITGAVFGMFYFLDKDGGNHVFVGTTDKLYHLDTQDGVFVDATALGFGYHASIDNPWTFTSYGETIIAFNGADVPQSFTIGDITFGALSSSAPIAYYGATVRDFLVLANVSEVSDGVHYPQRCHWSSIGNSANFPDLGTNGAAQVQSDAQDLRSDLGLIRGMAANLQSADMAIFLDGGVYSGYYVGSPAVFSFQIAQGAVGCKVPTSIVSIRGYAYYLGLDGFYAFDGTTPRAIGAQKIDRFFLTDINDGVDPAYIHNVLGGADPTSKLVYWLYHGPNSNGQYNRILIYNWNLDRWSVARAGAQWLSRAASMGYTLEQLDQFTTGTGIESLPFSLDSSVWAGGVPALYFMDNNGRLARFSGTNMAATIGTTEIEPTPFSRSMVTNTWPLVDGSNPTVALGSRNRLEEPVAYGPDISMNVYGACNQRQDARFFRGQISIPPGAWSHCEGLRLDFARSTPR